MKAVLGERGDQFERSRDPMYQQVATLVTRMGKPLDTAAEIMAVQRDIMQRASAQLAPNRSVEERQQSLTQLTTEMDAVLGPLLGEEGTAAYRNSPAGSWIQTLRQRASQPVRSPAR